MRYYNCYNLQHKKTLQIHNISKITFLSPASMFKSMLFFWKKIKNKKY